MGFLFGTLCRCHLATGVARQEKVAPRLPFTSCGARHHWANYLHSPAVCCLEFHRVYHLQRRSTPMPSAVVVHLFSIPSRRGRRCVCGRWSGRSLKGGLLHQQQQQQSWSLLSEPLPMV